MKASNFYDAIIIGFGKGGKTLAGALGAAGKRTVLIEKSSQMYGGTCINVGCIPTKYLVHKALEAKHVQDLAQKQQLYRQAIQDELQLTAQLREKNLKKAQDAPNVTVLTGTAQLLSANLVQVTTKDQTLVLEGAQVFLNTGSVPALPDIPGLQECPCALTSQDLLRQTRLPRHLVIIGGGYIGMEFASFYANFGSKVTVLQTGSRFLPREDADISQAVQDALAKQGVEVLTQAATRSVTTENDQAVLSVLQNGSQRRIVADTVLIATGRRPNTDGLGLENAGVALGTRGGVVTNEHLQTTAPNIYAMGDVVGGLQFTYISLDDHRIVRSAVLEDGGRTTKTRGEVPYSVFVDPPFSRVGMSEQEARDRGHNVKVSRLAAAAIPKALVLEQPTGLLKAIVDADTGKILGTHLFCRESQEMINIVKLAMDAGLPYTALRDMVFTHPTMSEALNDLFHI